MQPAGKAWGQLSKGPEAGVTRRDTRRCLVKQKVVGNVEPARAGAGERDEQLLRTLAAFAEDRSSGPSTHVRRLTTTY